MQLCCQLMHLKKPAKSFWHAFVGWMSQWSVLVHRFECSNQCQCHEWTLDASLSYGATHGWYATHTRRNQPPSCLSLIIIHGPFLCSEASNLLYVIYVYCMLYLSIVNYYLSLFSTSALHPESRWHWADLFAAFWHLFFPRVDVPFHQIPAFPGFAT